MEADKLDKDIKDIDDEMDQMQERRTVKLKDLSALRRILPRPESEVDLHTLKLRDAVRVILTNSQAAMKPIWNLPH